MKTKLKRNKIQKKIINQGIEQRTYILASDRCTSKPTGHLVAGLQSTDISCTMLAYIYSVHANMHYRASIGHNRFQPCYREALL